MSKEELYDCKPCDTCENSCKKKSAIKGVDVINCHKYVKIKKQN